MISPPKVCKQCDRLKVMSVYMSGECDYTCGCPLCEYREAFLQADIEERDKQKEIE